MRFLVDESTGPSVARWLREEGHQVFSIYDECRGITDAEVIQKAWREDWILVTNDKDFGDKVYREKQPHRGIILLRLSDERWGPKIETLEKLLSKYADRLSGNFVAATEKRYVLPGNAKRKSLPNQLHLPNQSENRVNRAVRPKIFNATTNQRPSVIFY